MTNKTPAFSETIKMVKARTGDNNDTLGLVLGVAGTAVSQRILGHRHWRLYEIDALADHWGIRPVDLMMGIQHAVKAIEDALTEAAVRDLRAAMAESSISAA